MVISAGEKIPAGALAHKTADGIDQVSTDDLFVGKTVVLFSVPGAFTPTMFGTASSGIRAEGR